MENALVPFDQVSKMAAVLGRNKLFGMGETELLPLMLIAQAEGKHPASAAQEYDIIQGKPALRSRAALARFQAAGGRIAWKKRAADEATATFMHPQGGELTVTWTMERAKKAGLTGKDNWQKYPEAMLSARVIAEGVRAVFPGCLSGMYLGEEVQDFDSYQPPQGEPEMRNVTPEPEDVPETDQDRSKRLAREVKIGGGTIKQLFPDEPRDYAKVCDFLDLVREADKTEAWVLGVWNTNEHKLSAVEGELKKEIAAARGGAE